MIPTLILLPGARLSSRSKIDPTIELDEPEEAVPPPHPPPRPPTTEHHVSVPFQQPLTSHKDVVMNAPALEEDSHVTTLTLHHADNINISAVVLFHNEYPTLNHTLYTWMSLLPHLDEVIFFLNGVSSATEFQQKLKVLSRPEFTNHRVVPSAKNLPLGIAIKKMVEEAQYENVLLLEKDWALIEDDAGDVLKSSVKLLDNGVHVVRLRHREFPGAPLHARMMHDGREDSILREQQNLFCYVHHWIDDPVVSYPEHFSVCPGTDHSEGIWCAKAKLCQWTNNPALFKRTWFLDELGNQFELDYEETVKRDPKSNMLDFEFYTNWKGEVWNDREFVVGLPRGLFEHQEIGEGGVMNTVWYAWLRLQKDVDEKRKDYLLQAGTACDGRDVTPDEGLWRFDERYPVDFVRHYSYPLAMNRTVNEGVAELRKESMAIRKRLEDGHGTWRNGVTDLTNLWYKIALFTYPSEPVDMKMAFVTALFHTDEKEEEEDGGRSFLTDVEGTAANLDALSQYSLLVYCTPATQKTLENVLRETHLWSRDEFSRLKFAAEEFDFLTGRLLGKENIGRISELRKEEAYRERVRNRTKTVPTQHALTLLHTKPYILDDAMHHLPDASHLVWIDASSPCLTKGRRGKTSEGGAVLGTRNDAIIRSQLFLHALVTGIPISTADELESAMSGSGFDTSVFLKHMEKTPGSLLGFVDMKTLGGSKLAISLMAGYYDVVLRDLLREKQLGTGREALSIARNNVDYHFRFYDGLNGCSRSVDAAHSCGSKKVTSSFMDDAAPEACRLYGWIRECHSI